MKIVIASGKGGTGKTTFSVLLSFILSKHYKTLYVDADVEEPNGHLFLKPRIIEETPFNVPVPKINENVCTFCGECSNVCEFKALVIIAKTKKWLFFPELCHSCSLCVEVCPEKGKRAIYEVPRQQGVIRKGIVNDNLKFLEGRLNLGEASGVRLIASLREYIEKENAEFTIIDAPPGTSCPVVESISLGDAVILTTEPTPFGLEDLKMAVEVVEKMNKPYFLAINKYQPFKELDDYIEEKNIKVIAKIPYSRKLAEMYSSGNLNKIFEDKDMELVNSDLLLSTIKTLNN